MKNRLFKKSVSLFLSVLMLCTAFSSISVMAEREYAAEFSVGGKVIDFENEPYSKFDTVFVPLDELCGYLNLDVTREGTTYTIKRMKDTLSVDIGNIVVNLNGKTVLLKNSLTERDGVIYAPVELFSEGLGCGLTLSEDKRSAELKPNIYYITITEQNAGAISAALPEKDTLVTSDSGADTLFYKPEESPEKEIAAYYKADLSDFAGKDISSARLLLHVARGSNLNQSIKVQRTKPWVKGELNFNNQPAIYDAQSVNVTIPSELKQSAKNWGDMTFNITNMFRSALSDGEEFSVKLLGVPYRNQQNPGSPQAHVKGVNTTTPPRIEITVNEEYSFPVKKAVEATADDTKFSELQLLYSMGVFTENDEFPLDMNESVTRGEFLSFAMRLRGSDIPTGSTEQFFSDVPVDSAYFAITSSARELGYIAGSQGAAFRPYDAITIAEAITILGRMLNYNVYADERGGFTPGYFEAAKLGDLYLGINDNKTLVSFNKMIDLLENALDAKMLDVVKFTSNAAAEYIFNENMTILTEFWDAEKIEGTVTANEYGSIVPGENGEEDYIRINSKRLKLNYEPYNNYLGYKVKGYYSKTEDVLLYIGTVLSDSTKVKLSAIEAVSETASTVSFSYRKANGKLAEESFSKNSVVIYNGKSIAANNVSAGLLKADGGDITIVGNNLVIINAYRTVVVFGTDLVEEIIFDYYEEYDNTVRLHNKDWTIKDTDGKPVELSSLQKYDVLSVSESIDGKYITAILERNSLSGTISLVEDPGTVDELLTIGGAEYETANRNNKWTQYISLGAEGKFLLDSWGNIVAFIPEQTSEIKGYIITIDYSGASALNNPLQAAIMVTGSEEYVLYEFADKLEIDGQKFSNKELVKDYFMHDVIVKNELGENVTERQFETQGIIFSLNSEKKINTIDTYHLGEKESEDTSLRKMANGAEELRYKSSGKLSDKFFWKYSNSLSVVSKDNSGALDSWMTINSGVDNDERVKPEVYTVGKDNPDAAIVTLKNFTPGSGAGSNYYVVDRVMTAFDAEGYEVKKLYYHVAPGDIKSVIVPDDKLHLLEAPSYDEDGKLTGGNEKARNGVKRGDIIKIGVDAVGELSALVEFFDYEDKVMQNLNTSFTAQTRAYGGYTTKVYNENIKVAPEIESMDTTYYWVKSTDIANFYRYEVNNAGVELFRATLADVRSYDKVPYNPTGILLQAHYATIGGTNFLLDMNQPAGTGIYSVKYEPNLPEGVLQSDLSAFPTAVERYNPGDIATSQGKGSVTLKDYEFIGWTNKATGEEIEPGGEVFVNENVVLQARWIANPSIDFVFTDEENPSMRFTMPYQQYSFATGVQTQVYQALPTAEVAGNSTNNFKKDGCTLIGWEGEDGTRYMLNNKVDPDSELYEVPAASETFKAIWMDAPWSGKAGTEDLATTIIDGATYYQIFDGEDLAKFSTMVNSGNTTANAILMNDVYLNSFLNDEGEVMTTLGAWYEDPAKLATAQGWWEGDSTKLGIGNAVANAYGGIFNGNNKTIHGLYIVGSSTNSQFALFGYANGATIKDLTIADAYLVGNATSSSSRTIGALVGAVAIADNRATNISNINVLRGKVTNGSESVYVPYFGSIVSYAYGSSVGGTLNITNCTSTISIDISTAPAFTGGLNTGIGGIAGRLKSAAGFTMTVDGCSYSGNIKLNSASTAKAGGILGQGTDGAGKKAYTIVKNCAGTFTAGSDTYVNAITGIGSNWTNGGNNTPAFTVTGE